MNVPYSLLSNSMAVYAATAGTSANGITPYTWASAKSGLSAVPCFLDASSSSDSLNYMRETGTASFRLLYPTTYNGTAVVLNAQDRVGVTVRGTTTAYRVVGQGLDDANQGVLSWAMVERLET